MDYKNVGQAFTNHYYAVFDSDRSQLRALYVSSDLLPAVSSPSRRALFRSKKFLSL